MFYQQRNLSRIFMSERQRGRHKQTVYRSFHVHGAVMHAQLHLPLAQISALFGSQNAIFVKHRYTWNAD